MLLKISEIKGCFSIVFYYSAYTVTNLKKCRFIRTPGLKRLKPQVALMSEKTIQPIQKSVACKVT